MATNDATDDEICSYCDPELAISLLPRLPLKRCEIDHHRIANFRVAYKNRGRFIVTTVLCTEHTLSIATDALGIVAEASYAPRS